MRDIKKKRTNSTSKAPKKELKQKKKNEEEFPFAAKNSKTSKEATSYSSFLPDVASSFLLKEGFINDLHLSNSVVQPISKSENMKKARTKEKCSKPSKIKVVLDEKSMEGNDDSGLLTGYKYVIFLLQGIVESLGGVYVWVFAQRKTFLSFRLNLIFHDTFKKHHYRPKVNISQRGSTSSGNHLIQV